MRIFLSLCIAILSALPLRAQLDTSSVSPSVEMHVGIGAQKFLHVGTRVGIEQILFEGDVGILPWYGHYLRTYSSYTVGVSLIPNWQKYAGGNFLFTVLYSHAQNIDNRMEFNRILTGNFSWLQQQRAGFSIIIRGGIGMSYANNYVFSGSSGYAWKREIVPWGNVEGSIGYAF